MPTTTRLRTDWPRLTFPDAPAPRALARSAPGQLASLLAAIYEVRAIDDPDLIFRRAIELGRDRIGLKRVSIVLVDLSRDLLFGTWGMDLSCAVVDEHAVIRDLCETDREALRRSEHEGAHFTVFANSPIVEHQGAAARMARRGWVAKTPIRSSRAAVGMMFNDAGLTRAPVDEVKQAHAAILCSLLGTMLAPNLEGLGGRLVLPRVSRSQRLVSSTVGMLNRDPGIGSKELATALNISASRLARVFKLAMRMSLVEYRNRLRLRRFAALRDRGGTTLLDTALAAGFGSYAQFHRVFRARLRASPREYQGPRGRGRGLPELPTSAYRAPSVRPARSV